MRTDRDPLKHYTTLAAQAAIDDGGSAFPLPVAISPAGDEHIAYSGVTVRDYFAARALSSVPMPQSDLHDIQASYDRIAQHAFKMADAMLRARTGSAP